MPLSRLRTVRDVMAKLCEDKMHVTRRTLALEFGRHLGVLLGKNAFSLIEQHVRRRDRRPLWCSVGKSNVAFAGLSLREVAYVFDNILTAL
mmetsp:Transcript_90154/g.289164  ORF Transcript_90154/g.289164 Transcript_90154/m.289164 type:complete len:91 (+) Transcript_90154:530-802(+)